MQQSQKNSLLLKEKKKTAVIASIAHFTQKEIIDNLKERKKISKIGFITKKNIFFFFFGMTWKILKCMCKLFDSLVS